MKAKDTFPGKTYFLYAKVGVRKEEMKVLGDVTAVFWDLLLEQSKYGVQYVIAHGQWWIRRGSYYVSTYAA